MKSQFVFPRFPWDSELRTSSPATAVAEGANRSRSLRTDVLQLFPKRNQSSSLSSLLLLPPSPAPVTFRAPRARCIWLLPGGLGLGSGQGQAEGLGPGQGQGASTSRSPKGEGGLGSPSLPPVWVPREEPRGEGSGAQPGPAASPFPWPGGQRGARGCPG